MIAVPTRRGTTNVNDRGNSRDRAARRAFLLTKFGDGETADCYRRDNIRPACGPCNSETGGQLGAARRWKAAA